MDAHDECMLKINEILNKIHSAVMHRKIDKLVDLTRDMHEIENKDLLQTCYVERGDVDLIVMICKYNKKKHLYYLLHQSHVLHYLTTDSTESKCKQDAFYYAMRSNQLEILEMLYDYWSGNLHWLGHKKEYNAFDVENLNKLHEYLQIALAKYEQYIINIKRKVDPYHMLNIQSLIAFNCFQRDLYTKLNELKVNLSTWDSESEDIVRLQETKAIKSMILVMFDIHEEHSKKGEHMIKNSGFGVENVILEGLADTSTLLHQSHLYLLYDVFFRKMDYNFCLLILDNLHLLKLRLSLSDCSYQKLENMLYHFIYHTSSKWSLYLPRRKRNKNYKLFSATFKGTPCVFTVTDNANKEDSASYVIYLERRAFEKAMTKFKVELLQRNIEENMRSPQFKLPNEDINTLMLLPNLRDDYSLKRISQHISQLYSINVKYENKYVFLLIERTLQVVGEFLKSSDESLHLHPSTEALVKAEISVEVVNDLKTLRNMLSHSKNGELLKRIEVETNKSDIFNTVLKELLFVKKKIDEVINIYKPMVERDLIRNALTILYERLHEMPETAQIYLEPLKMALHLPPMFRGYFKENFFKDTWSRLGFSESLMQEIIILGVHFDKLNLKISIALKNLYKNVIKKFPFHREHIEKSYKTIIMIKQKWQQIVQALKTKSSSINLSDYPNEEDANRIKSHAKKLGLADDFLIALVESNSLYSEVENHWHFIASLLDFIVKKSTIFNDTLEELKFSLFTHKLKELNESNYKKNHTNQILNEYLDLMEKKINEIIKRKPKFKTFLVNSLNTPKFSGITELSHRLTMANFLTQEERAHIVNITSMTLNSGKNNKAMKDTMEKIMNDISIPKKEYTNFVNSTNLDVKSQKILMNLVLGQKRDPLLPQCLSKRISALEDITRDQSAAQLVLRYKLDRTFRVLLEVLLFDIFAVLEGTKNDDITKKSSKLLTEINLRNVLTHGSALLEVVGDVLDGNDLATELVTKAMDFMHDSTSINALCALTDLGFDFSKVNDETIAPDHKDLLVEFKKSVKWKDYLHLVSGYKQMIYEKRKTVPVIDGKSMELLKAVNKKDALLIQEKINEGADVNFIDNHKKAVIHYAAMKGDVKSMGVLLTNGAHVNIRNKENDMTALHYSAMNNFGEAVDYLLNNGADCLAMDDKGHTPVYWAGLRNHDNVCRILRRAMKKIK